MNKKRFAKLFAVGLFAVGLTIIIIEALSGGNQAVAQDDDGDCVQPPAGLVSWWPGDGDADDIAGDNHGAPNGVTFLTGQVSSGNGQAFSFDGIDDFIEVPDAADLEPQSQFTFDAWIMPFDVSNPRNTLISKTQSSPSVFSYYINLVGQVIRFNASGTGEFSDDNLVQTTSPVIQQGVWQHVAVVYDGSLAISDRVKMYVDGSQVSTFQERGTTPASIVDASIPTLLGAYRFGLLQSFGGLIDEIEFHDRALSSSDIVDIFNAGSVGKCKFAEDDADDDDDDEEDDNDDDDDDEEDDG